MLTLRCSECEFEAAKAVLNRLVLFKSDASLLNGPYYEVKSKASPAIFADFLAAVNGKTINVHPGNVTELKELCDEFGFSSLDMRFEELGWCSPVSSVIDISSIGQVAIEMGESCSFYAVEKKLESAEIAQLARRRRPRRTGELCPRCANGADGWLLSDDEKCVFIGCELEHVPVAAFKDCRALEVVQFDLDRGSRLKSIGKEAFAGTKIKRMWIPASVIRVDVWAFAECEVDEFVVEDGNTQFVACGPLLLSFDKKRIVCYGGCQRVWIPKSVGVISEEVFKRGLALREVDFESGSCLVSIGREMFARRKIRRIVIPASVRAVCKDAFKQCVVLQSVEFETGSQLFSIANEAFSDTRIASIVIPASINMLCKEAFRRCQFLRTVEFETGSDLGFIGEEAFACTAITSIVIPASVKFICSAAFKRCKDLVSVTFESGSQLTTLGREVFYDTKIKSIAIPAGVNKVDVLSFAGCSIEEFNVEAGSTSFISCGPVLLSFDEKRLIYYGSFGHVRIPKSVEVIQDGAFRKDRKIQTVDFEAVSQLRCIGKEAFAGTLIKSIVIPASVTHIDTAAFKFMTSGVSVEFLERPPDKSTLENVAFEAGSRLVSIGKEAFAGTGIKHIVIPASVSEVDVSAFDNCDIEFVVESGSSSCLSSGSLLMSFDGTRMLCYGGCQHLVIPKSVEVIPEAAFKNRTKLETVDFEESSHLVSIGKEAFAGTRIRSIIIPASAIRIDSSAFSGCNIEDFRVEDGNASFVVHSSLLLSSDGKRIVCCFGKNVSIPDTVEEIRSRNFAGSLAVTLLVPMRTRVTIDSFSGCRHLKQLIFEDHSLVGRYVGVKSQGIIAHLARQCSGNVCDMGVIDVTVKSICTTDHLRTCAPKHLLDFHINQRSMNRSLNIFNEAKFFRSEDKPNQWFCIDFRTRKVKLTHYALCSCQLRSWALEASNDGADWTVVDRRCNHAKMVNRMLANRTPVATFTVANPGEFRFVRIRQIGETQAKNNELNMYGIELFGTLIE